MDAATRRARRNSKHPELWTELAHELPTRVSWEIRIEGRVWKILNGKEYNIKAMCARKTTETGRSWTAHPVYW